MGREDDRIKVYRRADFRWEWRRRAANGDVLSTSGNQGYENREDAVEMARELNPGITIEIEDV